MSFYYSLPILIFCLISFKQVTYRTLHPDAPESEWKMKNGEGEKHVKVVHLLNPSVDPEELFVTDEKPDDDGLGDSDDEDGPSAGILTNAVLQQHNYSIVNQVYKCLEASGSEGLTQRNVAERLGLSHLDSRSALRVLTRLRMADCVVKEIKKSRFFV